MDYEDMVGFLTDAEILQRTKNYRELDLNDANQKWLACSYIYAINNGLKDYQAKSFASEFTLFKTGEMFPSDVEHIYKEDWIDSHLCEKFEEFLIECDNEKDDLFWAMFKAYMISFYKSDYCTHYERIRHQLNLRLSDFEYEKFLSVPADRNIEKFIFLLRNFDVDGDLDYVREGKTSRKITFKYGESVYDLLMRVPAGKKSQKFLLCLYQFILK